MCNFFLANLHCFVARQFLSRIYALLSVKFSGLKMTNMRHVGSMTMVTVITVMIATMMTKAVWGHKMQTDTGGGGGGGPRQLEAPTESAAPNFPQNPPHVLTILDQYSLNVFCANIESYKHTFTTLQFLERKKSFLWQIRRQKQDTTTKSVEREERIF